MIRRGLRKPPRVILERITDEVRSELERFFAPRRAQRFEDGALLRELSAHDVNYLWEEIGRHEYVAHVTRVDAGSLDQVCPGDCMRILRAAESAMEHKVDLLGSGSVELGEQIDWHRDYKTGIRWPPAYFRNIEYNNREQPSDVKFPWEVSRLQWLIPVGQAYLLTGDERFAESARRIFEQWIVGNPYASSVNWACTMEVALRILSWTWFFHVFKLSRAWSSTEFRKQFLSSLYLHGDFTERHLERSDVNGNHYTANAAGLVFAGLFFGRGKDADRWLRLGWTILLDELPKQVYPDGVDFEASTAYHRLVFELFFLPALYRERRGLDVPKWYRSRLTTMARFTEAYTQPDGNAPLWGDADDARALPFGNQSINDHRYLIGLVVAAWSAVELKAKFSGPRSEIFWLLGPSAAQTLPDTEQSQAEPVSMSFPEGGCYIMRNRRDHVFIDCGPVGLGGRGGHGHNDCLSFEAVLDGVRLFTDCGAYLYTASYEERNNFRSTAYHNTPQIDGQEINRFIRPDYLWNLNYDAVPDVIKWSVDETSALFVGEHRGYQRLARSVLVRRTISLEFNTHSLFINDEFLGEGQHEVSIPLHLAADVEVTALEGDEATIKAGNKEFRVRSLCGPDYRMEVCEGRVSPRYGIALKSMVLVLSRVKAPLKNSAIYIAPVRYEHGIKRRMSRNCH